MADVFISYAREDRLAAQRVAETLKRHALSRPVVNWRGGHGSSSDRH